MSLGADSLRFMTDGNLLATSISLLSLILAASAVTWSIASWRRSGPMLRIHAHLYSEVLTVQLFNAGRTAERIERVILGGTRQGLHGVDITEALGGPIVLQASDALYREIPWLDAVPAPRQWLIRDGWESLWVLCGSMSEHRSDITPTGESRPPTTGWRLSRTHDQQTRYVPLIMAVPFGALTVDAPTHTASIGALFAVVLLVFCYRLYAPALRPRPSMRAKFQNRSVLVASVAFSIAWVTWTPVPIMFVIYLFIALVLAVPVVIPGLAIEIRGFATQLESIRARRAQKLSSADRPTTGQ
jgi:hypothetical protein